MNWTACQWLSSILLTPLLSSSDALTAGMRGYVTAGITAWEIIYFCLMALSLGHFASGPSPKQAIKRCLVVALLGWLATNATAYNTYIRDVFLNDLPNDMMNAISQAPLSASAFDKLMEKAFTAGVVVLQNLPYWPISIALAIIVTVIYWPISMVVILAGFLIWMIAKMLAAVCITLGPLMLLFFMISPLRGIAERWVSVMISSALVQYFAVAMTAIIVTTEGALVATFAGAHGDNIYNRLAGIVIAAIVLSAIGYMIRQVPAIALSIAGGIHFHVGAVTSNTIGRATGAIKAAGTAAATGGLSGAQAAYSAARNRISGPPGPSLSRGNRP